LTLPFYNRRAEKARLLSFAELALAYGWVKLDLMNGKIDVNDAI